MRTLLDPTNYYATFIIVLLTLNYNYLEAYVHHFTVKQSTFDISYVWLLITLIVVYWTYPGDAAPVLCVLILEFKISRQ